MKRFHEDQTIERKIVNIAGRKQIPFVPSIPYDPEEQADLFRDFSPTTHFSSLGLSLISKMRCYISLLFKVGQT